MSLASTGQLKPAWPWRYRVIGVDTFEGPTADYFIGDYWRLMTAILAAIRHGGEMNPVYVYNRKGVTIWKAGTY